MELSLEKKSKSKTKKTILFVCVHNSGRSQMAEGLFRKYAPEGFEAVSAETIPTSKINPLVIEVMKEVGIDIANQKPKELTDEMIKNSTKIIYMGRMDKNFCPALFVPKVIHGGIEDPKCKPIEKVSEIRDDIEKRVKEAAEVFSEDIK